LKAQGQNTKVFTSDIDNFWAAYDSVKTNKDSLQQLHFIQTLYLDKATAGLKDFMLARQHSAKRHLANILKYPKFWVSLRPHTLEIKTHSREIEELMQRFSSLYPKFKQPGVYFTVGVLNSGGTTTTDKILIGSEIACSDKTVDASELSSWLQGVFKDNKDVVYLVAHEAGHTQQRGDNGDNTTLLAACIREGTCDLIAELLLQKEITSPYMTYGKANEKKLWEDFQKEMHGQELKNWLYNGGNVPNADLGYFMGYTICKSYYNNAADKKEALQQIIELNYKPKSVLKFLENSKYNGGNN
jgi:hypothetical protein